jgi:GrpB-like predicted nucleotidyltransferase (UPF0157 family)
MQRHPSLDERFDPAIRIVDHDPQWARRAQQELARVAEALGDTAARLEHVGSTSVPGLGAKPIIDMQVSVVDIERMDDYVGPLEALGYLFAPDPAFPDYHYFAKPHARPRTHHLHVCEHGSHQELRHLAVRDYLRAHPDEAARYERLKRELVREHPQDRLAYVAGKDAFMGELEARAVAWATADPGRAPTSHERRSGRPWDDSYRDGPAPWDIGGPQAPVVRLCDQGAFVGPVLDAGCGSGDNALEIAGRDIEVIGVDVAPTAILQAQDKASIRGIAATFVVADALQLHRLGRTFRSVLDCGLFHTFDDDERPAYVAGLAAVTTPGSVLHLLCVSDATPGDRGPRGVSQSGLRASFGAGWNVVSIEPDRLAAAFDPSGLPAWRARIERA